jgi:hypothetical protein
MSVIGTVERILLGMALMAALIWIFAHEPLIDPSGDFDRYYDNQYIKLWDQHRQP